MRALTFALIMVATPALAEPPSYGYQPITQQALSQPGYRVDPNEYEDAPAVYARGAGEVGYEADADLEGNDWFKRPIGGEAAPDTYARGAGEVGYDVDIDQDGNDWFKRPIEMGEPQNVLQSIEEAETGL